MSLPGTLTLLSHSLISSWELPPNGLIMSSIIRVQLRPSCAASARRDRRRPRAPRSAQTAETDAAPTGSGTSPVVESVLVVVELVLVIMTL